MSNPRLYLCVPLFCFIAAALTAQNTPQQNPQSPPEVGTPVIRNDSRTEEYPPRERTSDRTGFEKDKQDRRRPSEEAGREKATKGTADGEPGNEFQDFVETSLGRRLPIFGQDLFRKAPSSFAPVDDVPVGGDFVIGPQDELIIRAWGQVDINYRATVDRNGNIYIPKVGSIRVAGVRFSDVENVLRQHIGRIFRNFELDVTMGRIHSIQVFVVGQARFPGTYTVSSLSSLVTVLFAAGGPGSQGSLRQIELRRNGKLASRFDLYELLLTGNKTGDVGVLNGDVIYIPPAGPMVAIAGSVRNPAIFEVNHGSTLKDLIELAGGLTPTADGQKLRLERIFARQVRRVEEFPLTADGLSQPLQDGDIVQVHQLSARFDNAVTLRGNVARPGRYPWRENMRVSDLIPSRDALVTPEYWLQQSQMSSKEPKKALDEEEEREAAVSKPNPALSRERQLDDRSRPKEDQASTVIRNEIKRAGPEINWDYAVIQRLNKSDLTTHLLPFNLARAIDSPASTDNLGLQPGDIVTIFSQADVRPAQQKQIAFVRLEGELQSVGVFQALPGETLRQLVTRVSGLTDDSFLFGAQFTREATSRAQERELQKLIDDMEINFEKKTANTAGLTPEQAATLKEKAEGHQRLVSRLRQMKPTGRIVLGMRSSDSRVESIPDIVLEDGDRFFVPSVPATVEVLGEVYSPNSYLFHPGRRVSDYLRSAGGLRRTADGSHVYVVRPDGSVVPRERGAGIFNSSFGGLKLMPGDTIVVPSQLEKGEFLRGLRDWSQVIAQFALGAASIRVISRP